MDRCPTCGATTGEGDGRECAECSIESLDAESTRGEIRFDLEEQVLFPKAWSGDPKREGWEALEEYALRCRREGRPGYRKPPMDRASRRARLCSPGSYVNPYAVKKKAETAGNIPLLGANESR